MPPLLHGQAEACGHRWAGGALRAPLRTQGRQVAEERLDRLRALKLLALVRGRWDVAGEEGLIGAALPGGSALADPRSRRGWVLIDDGSVAGFGAALAWALRRGVVAPDVLVDDGATGAPGASGVMARRAGELASPPGIWDVLGRELQPAAPTPVDPPEQVSEGLAELVDLLEAHGVQPVFEHGVLRGELLGLEVARVVGGRLEVGVGRHDRSARLEMRPGESLGDALDQAVAAVRARRRAGVARHPANTLARARWLRAVLCARPDLIGAGELRPVAPPLPWFDLPEAGAAPCTGRLEGGGPVVVVCSVGVEVDLVPTAADCRLIHAPGAELVLVLPEGDDVPLVHEMAELLARPARVRTVPRGWEELARG